MKPIQKQLRQPIQKPLHKKNAYSIKMGDITIKAEGTEPLRSIRNKVLKDAFAVLAKRDLMFDDDDDEEEDQQELLKQRIKHDIMFQ